jgi:hypothetical protein
MLTKGKRLHLTSALRISFFRAVQLNLDAEGESMTIKSLIRTIPHYPKQGVQFRDITTLLKDPLGLKVTVDELFKRYENQRIDKVVGIESRGAGA